MRLHGAGSDLCASQVNPTPFELHSQHCGAMERVWVLLLVSQCPEDLEDKLRRVTGPFCEVDGPTPLATTLAALAGGNFWRRMQNSGTTRDHRGSDPSREAFRDRSIVSVTRSASSCSQSSVARNAEAAAGVAGWSGPRTLSDESQSSDYIVGATALQTLIARSAAFGEQQKLIWSNIFHGKRTRNSMEMPERLMHGSFPKHKPRHLNRQTSVNTGLVFKLMLREIQEAGLHDRMSRCRGQVPTCARDGDKLHSKQSGRFLDQCSPSWEKMDHDQQLAYLKDWMLLKFSVDKFRRCMIPMPVEHWERAEISWGQNFFMTEAERQSIAIKVMNTYRVEMPQLSWTREGMEDHQVGREERER